MEKQASATAATMAKKESIWRDRFARHATSKQSVEAFCRSESVSSALFYQWRKRLDINAVNPALAMRTPSAASTFIDLGPVNDSALGTTPRIVTNTATPRTGTGYVSTRARCP